MGPVTGLFPCAYFVVVLDILEKADNISFSNEAASPAALPRIEAGFVQLNPPLPCVWSASGSEPQAGFVHALATDRLALRLVSTPRATAPETGALEVATSGTLTITLSETRHYALAIDLAESPAKPGWQEARVTTPEAATRLADMLTLVRKSQHITICETMDVEASDRYTGFSDLTLRPKALPDLDWDELDTSRAFLGRRFPLPLLITGMTGGLERGAEINRRLARAAEHFGIPMGVGSQRVALDNPEHAAIFSVKQSAPRLFLIGNIGIAQLRGPDALQTCLRAIDMIEADALAVHVNVLQEVVQVEGDRAFRGLLDRIAEVAHALPVPLIVKEVGGGIDPETALRLVEAGVHAIDCGGKGGTSWSYIEGVRAQSPVTQAVASTFRDWGVPTAVAVAALRKLLPKMELVATGGLRDGLSVAKAVALGATMCGVGLPIFRAALAGEEDPFVVLETLATGLRTAMICSGARDLEALRGRLHVRPAFLDELAIYADSMDHMGSTAAHAARTHDSRLERP